MASSPNAWCRESPVFWCVTYQDGTSTNSDEGPWTRQARQVIYQQEILSIAEKPIAWIEFRIKEEQGTGKNPLQHLDIPDEALAVFAYTQYATPIAEQSEPIWLYTCFGYLTPTAILRWKLNCEQSIVQSTLRPHVEVE